MGNAPLSMLIAAPLQNVILFIERNADSALKEMQRQNLKYSL